MAHPRVGTVPQGVLPKRAVVKPDSILAHRHHTQDGCDDDQQSCRDFRIAGALEQDTGGQGDAGTGQVDEALGHEPVVQAWLAELRLPTLEGMSGAEVEDYFAHARARDLQQHWEGLPGGESFRHFYERVSSGVESLLVGEHPLGIHENSGYRVWQVPEDAPERLLIVAHAGTNAVILSHLLGIEPVPWAYVRFESAWAGISRVRSVPLASGAIWQLEAFSATSHLAGLPDQSPPDSESSLDP